MKKRSNLKIELDPLGRVILPIELTWQYGLTAGASVRLEEDVDGFWFSRSSESLARVYVEPTNQCNLNCITCMRNVWDEPPGWMSPSLYQRVIEGIRSFQPVPSIFFGGFGEPLTFPNICEMVEQAHQIGATTELITNGILLNESMIMRLRTAGLNRIWVSLDGVTPESYTDVRLGAALPQVIGNLHHFQEVRGSMINTPPFLGIAFVAMKRNIAELPDLIRLGINLGADRFSVTNVLPYSRELREEMLCLVTLQNGNPAISAGSPLIQLPRMDIDETTVNSLMQTLKNQHQVAITRQEISQGGNSCPFMEKGSLSVRWDGSVSPCLPLLHSHESYLDDHLRKSQAFSFGNLNEKPLAEIWEDPSYRDFRERLLSFDFSPCVSCNSCEMAHENREDCLGNILPACGGCLWAQGYIQCP